MRTWVLNAVDYTDLHETVGKLVILGKEITIDNNALNRRNDKKLKSDVVIETSKNTDLVVGQKRLGCFLVVLRVIPFSVSLLLLLHYYYFSCSE